MLRITDYPRVGADRLLHELLVDYLEQLGYAEFVHAGVKLIGFML